MSEHQIGGGHTKGKVVASAPENCKSRTGNCRPFPGGTMQDMLVCERICTLVQGNEPSNTYSKNVQLNALEWTYLRQPLENREVAACDSDDIASAACAIPRIVACE